MTTTPSAGLVVVDMLNRYEHDDAGSLRRSVREVLPVMRSLIGRARERDVPIVYVNDNHGDWSAGGEELCRRALEGRTGDASSRFGRRRQRRSSPRPATQSSTKRR